MHSNVTKIEAFYVAFARRDGAAMASLYAPDATFSDPAFPNLRGREVPMMWAMLTERAKDFSLTFRDVSATDTEGRAHWEAKYRFGKNPVHNIIDAHFTFKDGLVTRHVDTFDFARWSKQALGPVAWGLGWTGLLPAMVQRQAAAGLAKYLAAKGSA